MNRKSPDNQKKFVKELKAVKPALKKAKSTFLALGFFANSIRTLIVTLLIASYLWANV